MLYYYTQIWDSDGLRWILMWILMDTDGRGSDSDGILMDTGGRVWDSDGYRWGGTAINTSAVTPYGHTVWACLLYTSPSPRDLG